MIEIRLEPNIVRPKATVGPLLGLTSFMIGEMKM